VPPAKAGKLIEKNKMLLLVFAANVDFSQWSLSISGIPVESAKAFLADDKTGTARMFEWFLLEQNHEFRSRRNAKDHWR